jgi:hypothetical protein
MLDTIASTSVDPSTGVITEQMPNSDMLGSRRAAQSVIEKNYMTKVGFDWCLMYITSISHNIIVLHIER